MAAGRHRNLEGRHATLHMDTSKVASGPTVREGEQRGESVGSIGPLRRRGRPVRGNEGFADLEAASPFRLPRLHPGIGGENACQPARGFPGADSSDDNNTGEVQVTRSPRRAAIRVSSADHEIHDLPRHVDELPHRLPGQARS